MPSKKYQKLLQKDPASFRRGKPVREPAETFLIVTEGTVSEKVYFGALKQRLRLRTVRIAIEPAGIGDPQRLAERACEILAERQKSAKSGKLGFHQPRRFDNVWIVFDTDTPADHGRLQSGLEYAAGKGLHCAHSTPSFEFWLLLHLEFTTASMSTCAEVIPRLSAAIGVPFTKNAGHSEKIIPPFLDRLDSALENAGRVRSHHAEVGSPFPAKPSTEVDGLIHSILRACNLDTSSV